MRPLFADFRSLFLHQVLDWKGAQTGRYHLCSWVQECRVAFLLFDSLCGSWSENPRYKVTSHVSHHNSTPASPPRRASRTWHSNHKCSQPILRRRRGISVHTFFRLRLGFSEIWLSVPSGRTSFPKNNNTHQTSATRIRCTTSRISSAKARRILKFGSGCQLENPKIEHRIRMRFSWLE